MNIRIIKVSQWEVRCGTCQILICKVWPQEFLFHVTTLGTVNITCYNRWILFSFLSSLRQDGAMYPSVASNFDPSDSDSWVWDYRVGHHTPPIDVLGYFWIVGNLWLFYCSCSQHPEADCRLWALVPMSLLSFLWYHTSEQKSPVQHFYLRTATSIWGSSILCSSFAFNYVWSLSLCFCCPLASGERILYCYQEVLWLHT
jgi:hypothetical protein